MITLVISIFIANKKLFVQNLLYITIPTVFVAVTTLAIMFLLDIKIWYYRIDVIVTQVSFDVTLICCFVNIAKQTKKIQMKNTFIKLFLPVFVLTTGYEFSQVYLFSKFKEVEDKEKYLIRLVYYPLIVEVSLTLVEYGGRTFDGGNNITVHRRAHFLFSVQATLAMLGRYLTTISGSLLVVTVISVFHFLKDVFVHRLSWLYCYIAHKFKRLLRFKEGEENFNEWFYSSNFQEFRACVFNNDFVIELVGKKITFCLYFVF